MWLGWGQDLAFFYNDAYVPTLGVKHPTRWPALARGLGERSSPRWKDRFASVMRDGVARPGTRR